jgi:hypothetical protein
MSVHCLHEMLASQRAALVEEWFGATVASYPAQMAQFLRREADRFRNPAGHALRDNLGIVFDAVILSDDWDRAARALGDLLQLRAVQDFTPSEAVGFIPPLRDILGRAVTGLKSGSTGRESGSTTRTAQGSVAAGPWVPGPVAQDFSPVLADDLRAQIDARVDRLITLASEMHANCRLRMDEIRAREVTRRTWVIDRVHRRQI